MNAPLVVFRADAALHIGTGHVMRCITLAETLRARGAACRFVCRAHPGHLIEHIRQRGFAVAALPSVPTKAVAPAADGPRLPAHPHWLGADWQTDAEQTRAALGDEPVDWLVVDHYALDARWEQRLRPACRRLMVIDDLADRPHACDLLLDQNLGRRATDYAALVPDCCAVLAGPQYALLRPEFAALRPYSLARRERPRLEHLLVTMGGVDKDNATGRVLDALRCCPLPPDGRLTVVMGARAPWLEHVRGLAATLPWPSDVRVDVDDMAQLMADSDLAIGAAGTTAWERCCLGLPSISMILAPNQKAGALALGDAGAVLVAPHGPELAARLAEQLRQVSHTERLAALSAAARAITDGGGAWRVVEAMAHERQ